MAIIKIVGGIFLSLVVGLAKDEVKAWIPRLTRWVLAKATGRLPADYRSRYEEEWLSDIEDLPGEISRLLYSVGLMRAAWAINRADRGEFRSFAQEWLARSIAAVLLTFFAPLGLALAAIVRLQSYGPILLKFPFRDWNGRRFIWWRFRSFVMMKIGGEEYVRNTHSLLFIARTFNGLLLLVNVAKGEMAFAAAFGYVVWKARVGVPDIQPLPVETVIQ